MSYHPNYRASQDDDRDSDLDLDLNELDPVSSTQEPILASSQRQGERRRQIRDLAVRIPLRNLRVGRLRRGRNNGEGSTAQEDHDELGGLLDDDDYKRLSAGSSATIHDDDAPLLPGGFPRKKPPKEQSTLAKLGTKLRIPSLVRSGSRPTTPGGMDDVEPEAENDHDPSSNRNIIVGQAQATRFPPNAISNAKYTPLSFLPRTLYNEFSFFINLYFLLVALSQTIPALRIGYLSTYIVPLAFVISITLSKEALDDIARRRRDAEANSECYKVLKFEDNATASNAKDRGRKKGKSKKAKARSNSAGNRFLDMEDEERFLSNNSEMPTASVEEVLKASKDLKVGDVVKLGKDQRVPADMVLLQSASSERSMGRPSGELDDTETDKNEETSGEAFIRTDQLDGETDWKLRLASPLTQSLNVSEFTRLQITAAKPDRKVNEFVGNVQLLPKSKPEQDVPDDVPQELSSSAPLTIDNTLWANTVLASSSTVLAVVVYTGSQTRQALSTSPSRSKTGLLEYEINSLTKILCILTLSLSGLLVAIGRFEAKDEQRWYVSVMRFLILFSTIIPVSLRVNLDLGKSMYARFIERDMGIPGTVVRTSTIPEDLGRVEYLLSDKTGTLTQNEMELKKIHVGTVSYANEAMDEVVQYVRQGLSVQSNDNSSQQALLTPSSAYNAPLSSATRTRREIGARVRDVVFALALCHNVTPTMEEVDGKLTTTYQASSPDEIAIVRWTESMGLRLLQRDRHSIVLQSVDTGRVVVRVQILNIFPFTSEGKRMGIVVKFDNGDIPSLNDEESEIWFYQKGADTVMATIVAANDWLEEETANMAREGLRTLVVGRKRLSFQVYEEFSRKHSQAALSLHNRDTAMAQVVQEYLERDLELLGVTGVEDKLQRDVKPSLELLRNAGIKIWMLTGDKVETARCVAVSSKLVARGQYVHTIAKLKRKDLANDSLDFLRGKPDACLLIDGESLGLMLKHYRDAFISVAVRLPTVVACRCSPTQKADVAKLIRAYTKKRICCIGDGGNDVSMIQAADVGIGIVGKEGKQASLAADFSIEQFCYLTKLLVWHGRNSYKRSAKLAQFIIHRGLIISVCQTIYSIASRFEPIALYRDWLLVGYATIYTMMPVFSLVLDRDVEESLVSLYPELYKELTTGRSLSYRSFFIWVAVSVYQGSIIQGLSQVLVGIRSAESPSSALSKNAIRAAEIISDDPVFRKMVAVSFTVLVLNELVMVAAEVTTWHPAMIFSILGTAAIYFGSVPFLGEYFDLKYIVSIAFVWRVAVIAAVALIPPYAGKLIGRTLRPPSYRKVRGI